MSQLARRCRVAACACSLSLLAACGGSDAVAPGPEGNVRVKVSVTGSGGTGSGIDLRIGTATVTVTESAAGLDLAPGTYDVALAGAPEWCEVDALPTSLTVPATGRATLALSADCVGGIAYEETPGSIHEIQLRLITREGFDIQLTSFRRGRHELEGWSPDGRQIGFATGFFSDPPRLVLWDLEEEAFDQIPFDGTTPHHDLAWSPDGEQIAYTLGSPTSDGRLMIAARDGSDPVPLLPGVSVDAAPSWSPHGERIAFATYRSRANRTLHLVDADGTGLTELDDRWADAISWSFDGSWIAYVREERLAVITPEADRLIFVADVLFSEVPRWSPDRNVVGFTLDGSLQTYDVESDVRSVVVDLENEVRGWSWSGDGEWIAFSYPTAAGGAELRIVRPDGTGMRTIRTSPDQRFRAVLWDPTTRH